MSLSKQVGYIIKYGVFKIVIKRDQPNQLLVNLLEKKIFNMSKKFLVIYSLIICKSII